MDYYESISSIKHSKQGYKLDFYGPKHYLKSVGVLFTQTNYNVTFMNHILLNEKLGNSNESFALQVL